MIDFPCKICQKNVNNNHKAIKCDLCETWVHIKCNKLDDVDYENLRTSTDPWYYIHCTANSLPFGQVTDQQFFLTALKGTNTDFDTNTDLNLQRVLNRSSGAEYLQI